MDIFDMIDKIEKRPGMYIGSNSITALFDFLAGYHAAEVQNDLYRKGEFFPLPFQYMHEYAKYRLKADSSQAGWCNLILEACDGAEDDALQKFFEIYRDFKHVRMKKYWKAVLSADHRAWHAQMKGAYRYTDGLQGKEPIYRNPLAVYVIELDIPAYILAVETQSDIQPEILFFESARKAMGCGTIPEGAGIYFGLIDTWEEYAAENISFGGKRIIIDVFLNF